jgi:hypothetical protein
MFSTRHRAALIAILLLGMGADVFAASTKKDFRGLFGNYRREQYVENEGRNTDVGFDVQLSTLLPISPVVKSVETTGGAAESLQYTTFFNLELSLFVTLAYHWELYGSLGYYTYDTRKQNTVASDPSNPGLPSFHQFEMTMIPAVAGVRYRFTTDDIVPYIGAGVGMAYTKRKGFYDYSDPTFHQQYLNAIVGQAQAGVEFFIAARAGIRLEVSAYFMNLPAFNYQPGATVSLFPAIQYQANPWSVRYSSGLFVLF